MSEKCLFGFKPLWLACPPAGCSPRNRDVRECLGVGILSVWDSGLIQRPPPPLRGCTLSYEMTFKHFHGGTEELNVRVAKLIAGMGGGVGGAEVGEVGVRARQT